MRPTVRGGPTTAPILRVGLTGGLAAGKSTVGGLFRAWGAFHLDADRIAHELIAPGGRAHDAVLARFGGGILRADGTIDRTALGARVFADPSELSDLNAILHPLVRDEIASRIAAHAAGSSPSPVAVVDAPLLVESGIHLDLDALVVVACSPETQVARAVSRGGMSDAEARRRVAAQAPLAVKVAAADYVIDTGGTLAETEHRARAVWAALLTRARGG